MRVASVTLVPWTRPCAGLWWCRRRLLVGGPCAYVPESIRYCYALRGPPPVVLGWGGHCANIVMCSHGEVGLRRGLFTTELRKPARRSCLARAQGPAQGPSAILGRRWARGRFWCLGRCGCGNRPGALVWPGHKVRHKVLLRFWGVGGLEGVFGVWVGVLPCVSLSRFRSTPVGERRIYGLQKKNH